jgi:hypothetical protein
MLFTPNPFLNRVISAKLIKVYQPHGTKKEKQKVKIAFAIFPRHVYPKLNPPLSLQPPAPEPHDPGAG